MNKGVMKFIGISINVNGIEIPLVPLISLVNLLNFYFCLEKIQKMNRIHAKREAEGHHYDAGYQDGQYLAELYQTYRDMIMNICCMLLVFQLYITSHVYEKYKPHKDKADNYIKG